MNLASLVDKISEEFMSTFTVINDNTLINYLDHTESDFETLKDIIKKYLPNCEVHFKRTNQLYIRDLPHYDIYIITTHL